MLAPYRVIDFTDERGVLAGQMLADLGADVIQVEPPSGSSGRRLAPFFRQAGSSPARSIFWAAYTRGKRGVTCDLAHPRGRELAQRLIRSADFVFESSDIGAMTELGLGYEQAAGFAPEVVYASISAFGQAGPKSRYAASDLVIWAAGTPLLMTGDDDRRPVRISAPQAWAHAAADAAGGAMLAHFARLQTGRGQHVDVSAQVSAAQATLGQILAWSVGASEPQRSAGGSKTRGVGTVPAADGYVVMAVAPGPAIGHFANHAARWLADQRACDPALAEEDFVTWAERAEAGEADPTALERLREGMIEHVAAKTKQQMLEASIEYDLLLTPVLALNDIAESAQLESRDFWRDLAAETGSIRFPGPPLKVMLDGEEQRWGDRPPPRLGEHNREVYRELGLADAEINDLAAEGVI